MPLMALNMILKKIATEPQIVSQIHRKSGKLTLIVSQMILKITDMDVIILIFHLIIHKETRTLGDSEKKSSDNVSDDSEKKK